MLTVSFSWKVNCLYSSSNTWLIFLFSDKIAGVQWGVCGSDIVALPFLEDIVTYGDDGSASFEFNVNASSTVCLISTHL